ncbi:hippocampus abundant transcript 1 protein-like isoform X1 [Brassica napus]|uniref:hippocampus abundant transcript 1 protein isoform X1 n=1 Tax=Brassica oleracea var. oleracea TaxID=109376 RepID=UPI0006A7195F|nr:PREDICTED: hippocampus abundant transcript 1 protein isoform X1 [Brassica oleracea var. oleracea]XP_013621536.1 PREDICTED: hippocampus abundant transcript 1 protein isoform X1 [Brassica oleracea var. oleracea]XP_048603877.1 hippocampus abundant transcript 1 protein-like isoform X1 [Brassica napus]XP_048603878.1 hippocampus abundant transcript 1 protein-like isoform X1 [Brassica napus]XP_048603879.1 hippocampus abundant transcript 1 protein-like isoform X1 [Brassica napus]XP_048603880.1 hipp
MEETTTFQGLRHLFMTVFLHGFSAFIVVPVITDVSMAALCPGKDECSLAIYLSGFQQAITGVGSLMMMPLVGSLSDKHGRKSLLTLPMALNILPLAILAYSRETSVFYIYYVLKTFTSIFCEGSVFCLALAYVADNVSENQRASAFGILTGIGSCAFVCANCCARFLSTTAIFQVATTVAIFSTVYMRIFLPDSIRDNSLVTSIVSTEKLSYVLLEDYPGHRNQISRTVRSVREMASLMRSSVPLFQVAMVSFFSSLSEAGLHASSMYYLKAKFQFNKDQFADLMIIFGIAGSVSQLLFMPILIPALKEEKLLSIGLFFGCAHMFLLGMAWSAWVPYMAAMFSLVSIFHQSCMRSIVSKQVTSYEQGKAQGIISSICSLANVISPLAFSPLTGWFLSERAPFHFPGFSLMCAGFTMTIAFILSLMIRATTPVAAMGSP